MNTRTETHRSFRSSTWRRRCAGLGERNDKHGKDFSDWADMDGNDKIKLGAIISELSEWIPEEVNENIALIEELSKTLRHHDWR